MESNGTLHGADGLTSSQSQTIASLLAGAPFPAPTYLKDLLKDGYDKVGEEEIDLVEPVQIVETTNPPSFRWKPIEAAKSYEVELRDHRNWVVRKSGKLQETEWNPSKPLNLGEAYSWRVVSGKRVSHWAKFLIPGAAAMAEIQSVREVKPSSHLLLAIAYARCGALASADAELSKLDGELVKRWRSQVH